MVAFIRLERIGTTARGWECAVAHAAEGRYWVVIHDGLSTHEGVERPDPVTAAGDVHGLIVYLESLATAAQASATMGPN